MANKHTRQTLAAWVWPILGGFAGLIVALIVLAVVPRSFDATVRLHVGDDDIKLDEVLASAARDSGVLQTQSSLGYSAQPIYLPLIGELLASAYDGTELAPALFGMDSFAWGGESINFSQFAQGPQLRDASLTLTVGDNQSYILGTQAGTPLMSGSVGELLRKRELGLSLLVGDMQARPRTRFRLRPVDSTQLTAALSSMRATPDTNESALWQVSITSSTFNYARRVLHVLVDELIDRDAQRKLARKEIEQARLANLVAALRQDVVRVEGRERPPASLLSVLDAAARRMVAENEANFSADIARALASKDQQAAPPTVSFDPATKAFIAQLDEYHASLAESELLAILGERRYGNALRAQQMLADEPYGSAWRVIDDARVVNVKHAVPAPWLSLLLGSFGGFALVWLRRRLARNQRKGAVNLADTIEATTGVRVTAVLPTVGDAGGNNDAAEARYQTAMRSLVTAVTVSHADATSGRVIVLAPISMAAKSQQIGTQLAAGLARTRRVLLIEDSDSSVLESGQETKALTALAEDIDNLEIAVTQAACQKTHLSALRGGEQAADLVGLLAAVRRQFDILLLLSPSAEVGDNTFSKLSADQVLLCVCEQLDSVASIQSTLRRAVDDSYDTLSVVVTNASVKQ